jgi:hypothetical protein
MRFLVNLLLGNLELPVWNSHTLMKCIAGLENFEEHVLDAEMKDATKRGVAQASK